eukprot:scaffold1755_cov58-Phaeocystis_antarctica.AAC.2
MQHPNRLVKTAAGSHLTGSKSSTVEGNRHPNHVAEVGVFPMAVGGLQRARIHGNYETATLHCHSSQTQSSTNARALL